ncbi:MAG: Acylphosphate phosphohydrolase [Brockia lithotrophica]|uniref:acylphosphatase n=1 Tax=Brockia lithotrophica TaxID=933949 RepID=A0A2T5G7P5_9BACL|nr:acylphosphatase [Brockia lithotrophica]PTQ52197.1 MAG: Acylphosphate phosphohydrolase [Brockia lithotrophica]
MKRLFLRIVGRVQGVGYRAFVLREATRRGITGWVRNEPDGTVTAEVQGDDRSLSDLLLALEEGPPAARVDDLVIEERPVVPEEKSFRIAYR